MFINYVKAYLEEDGNSLDTLKKDFGIDSRVTDDGLVIFSYSQTESPKTNPIVRMCRGLVLELDTWEIMNYPFYRFYNFEEVPEERIKFNWNKSVATTKIDGSLLNVFWDFHNKHWQIATRSCIGGENQINDFGTTFNDLFDEAVKPFSRDEFFKTLHPEYCYMFELVSPFNQIITHYSETKLYCIGARVIDSFNYHELRFDEVWKSHPQWSGIIRRPEIIPLCDASGHFTGFDKMKELAESVGSHDEGFVVVDFDSMDSKTGSFPRVKVKNSAYVALHHLRGTLDNGQINFGEILSVVYKGEQDEVCAVLPHYKKYFDQVTLKWKLFCQEFSRIIGDDKFTKFWQMSPDERIIPENKKNFALKVMEKDSKKFSQFLFLMYNKNYISLKECIEHNSSRNIKDTLKDLWKKYFS